jgi:hypothetical protein
MLSAVPIRASGNFLRKNGAKPNVITNRYKQLVSGIFFVCLAGTNSPAGAATGPRSKQKKSIANSSRRG